MGARARKLITPDNMLTPSSEHVAPDMGGNPYRCKQTAFMLATIGFPSHLSRGRCMFRSARPFGLLVLALFCQSSVAAPEVPGAKQSQPIALAGGWVHTASGEPIAEGVVVFDGGKITAVGKAADVPIPDGAKRIDVAGKHVYPGLIDAHTDLGVVEIPSTSTTVDDQESGDFNPNVLTRSAFNPDSELLPVARANGVLLAVSAPTGPFIQGQSALMRMDGWTYESMTQRSPVAMHIQWPRMTPLSAWWVKDSPEKQTADRDAALDRLKELIEKAESYRQAKIAAEKTGENGPPVDLRYEAMKPVLEGTLPWMVSADDQLSMETAVQFLASRGMKLVIYGGYDAEAAADTLKRWNTPVVLAGVHRLPLRRDEAYDEPFTLPTRLKRSGVAFCISGTSRWSSLVRNLPYHAATAAAFGLDKEDAIRALTLWPAQIVGAADRVGSLDVGKDATLFVADGDILEVTSHVQIAYIEGREVALTSRHTRLRDKYEEKYKQLGK